jgi:hypothetical protein
MLHAPGLVHGNDLEVHSVGLYICIYMTVYMFYLLGFLVGIGGIRQCKFGQNLYFLLFKLSF